MLDPEGPLHLLSDSTDRVCLLLQPSHHTFSLPQPSPNAACLCGVPCVPPDANLCFHHCRMDWVTMSIAFLVNYFTTGVLISPRLDGCLASPQAPVLSSFQN
jgi:hypothetical protein